MKSHNHLKSRIRFAETESLFPYAVLSQDGKVVWSGHPTELESVIRKVVSGKFSASRQKQIEAVRQDRLTRFGDVPDSQLRVETAGTFESEEQAQRWRQLVQAEFPTIQVSYVQLPCSISTH